MFGLPFDPAVSASGCRARADGRTRRCLELRGQLVVLAERVGPGNGMDVLGHVRRAEEAPRHVARLAGGESPRGEAEAFGVAKIPRSARTHDTGHGVADAGGLRVGS